MVFNDPPPINELLAPDWIVFEDPLPMKEFKESIRVLAVPAKTAERAPATLL
jgi:hypothetical protein